MMKHFKKLTLITTATFLFVLTAISNTGNLLPLPGITIGAENTEEETPEEPDTSDEPEISEDPETQETPAPEIIQ